MKTDDYI